MNALSTNRYTEAWRSFGASYPQPRAILVVSAHWYVNATAITAMTQPRTIHDFFGFPKELFAVQYPARGDPAIAEEVAEIVKPVRIGLDQESWGIDHGTWSLLVHAFPRADIPVLQLSINAERSFEEHFALAAKLAPLRERGVLIIGSGNVVHNLRAIDWSKPDAGYDWARRFDEAARVVLVEAPGDVPSLARHGDYAAASPTPDHFIPVIYFAGLAAAAGRPVETLIDGFAYGSLSMACYTLDGHCHADARAAAGLPDPAVVAPADANT